jgi:translocation and assembly module TamB
LSSDAPPPPKRRLWRRVLLAIVVLVVLLAASVYAMLGSQAALDYVVRRAVAAGEGHLAIEGAEGSLLSTVRIARIAWQGDQMNVEARETAVAWSPFALLSRKVSVQGLGAKQISLELKPAQGGRSGGLPPTLALPLEVEVRNIGVQRLEWTTGANSGYVTGITFDYRGGASEHAVDKLRFVTGQGTLSGGARLGAAPPYALSGTLDFEGDGEFKGGKARLAVSGNLEALAVDAKGTLRNADLAVQANVTPFASTILTSADVDGRNVDLSQFAQSLPVTKLSLTLAARPQGAGFAGSVSARNEIAGAIDADRIPVAELTAKFAWDGSVLTLTDASAVLAGNGRASGSVAVPVKGGPVKLDLALANVDLQRIMTSLIATRLSGTLAGEVDKERQVLRGDLREKDLALAFAAIVEKRKVTLTSARAQAGGGTLTGTGTIDLDVPRAFTIDARAARFNPARFVSMPDATLDGTVVARGTVKPLAISGEVKIAEGSKLAGLEASGTVRGDFTASAVKNVAADVALGTARAKVTGGYGTAADKLAYDIDIERIAQLRPLLVRYAKASLPDPFAGSLRARGTVAGDPRSPGVTVDAHAEGFEWGSVFKAALVDASGSIAAGPAPLAARAITLRANATRVTVPQGSLVKAAIAFDGTLAQHRATMTALGDTIDFNAAVSGGIADVRKSTGAAETAWSGRVESLANRGAYPFMLTSPATLSIARDRVDVGDAHLSIAQGRVDVVRLTVEEGRVSTQGSLTGVPVDVAAKLAGRPLPFASTMAVGGTWSITATPRLNGTFTLQRERGDWFADTAPTLADESRSLPPEGAQFAPRGGPSALTSTTLDPADLALGISVLQVTGRFDNDALTASAQFRSARAGTADATMTLGAGRTPGMIDTTAPFTASVTADLASLRPLQPWIGTVAVMDGRAHVAVSARGSLANPTLEGTMSGDALRFDLPQYGVHLKDGLLRARLADHAIELDEFSFGGGAGRFTAKGIVTRAEKDGRTGGKVEWTAKDFTIVNRPDLRLVADGSGTLAIAGRKLALAGSIDIDEGQVNYEPARVGKLSDDVVIAGEPRKSADNGGVRDLPLTLDLQVALGRNFRFSGEGLDTRLAGRVHVVTAPSGALTATGTIRAVAGTYYAFGQKLDIDRGRLIFDGPVDNPALDVVALRKNLAVEAGVELTGTVKFPNVRLVSNPPVPDGEKLSWLLTGQGLDRASRNDLALIGAAAGSLISGNQKPITTQIANKLGLDDISVRDTGTGATSGTSTQVVAFGKRISDRLSLIYEQGLSVANNALRIEYALTRTLTLRAEAGQVASFGLYFRRSYD